MKIGIQATVLLSACLLASCAKQNVTPTVQTANPELVSRLSGNTFSGLQPVALTPQVKATCVAAIGKMKLMRNVPKSVPANSMAEAQSLIWRNINIANPHTPRACVEHNGWFLVSRLNTAGSDDGSFKTGIAVKKGTTEIYKWK